MHLHLVLPVVGSALAASAINFKPHPLSLTRRASSDACSALNTTLPSIISNLTITTLQYYNAGDNVTVGDSSGAGGAGGGQPGGDPTGASSSSFTDLPAFCRVAANITTSSVSQVAFELWMPAESWNQRFMMVGNGGDAGSISYTAMLSPIEDYGFATASTNTGHYGSIQDGSFAMNNTESAIDFGYRAVHLSTVYSKEIINAFYGQNTSHSYWNGCSAGGKQGFKSAQMFPEDFDGVLAGAPAAWTPRLDGHQYWRNIFVNTLNTTGYITSDQFTATYSEVLRQCDAQDGLVDSVITEPDRCKLDYTQFACNSTTSSSPYVNATNCLSDDQMKTFVVLHNDYHFSDTGELLFPAHQAGTEDQWGQSMSGTVTLEWSYFNYQVLNYTTPQNDSNAVLINGTPINETQLEELVRTADETNPANTTAFDTDLQPFFSRGGKLLHYHGAADGNIPTGSSIVYRDRLIQALGNVSDSYRFYTVDGLHHCNGGVGPVNFGGAGASPVSQGGSGHALKLDAQYDAVTALMAWTENNTAPSYLVGWYGDNIESPQFTRKICPYPEVARFVNSTGDWTDEASFVCY